MSNHDNPASEHGQDSPPDRASEGDVSTTGHSSHDAAHGADAHDSHGGGHGGPDTSDASTLAPAGWPQLILPAIILIFVAILVAGPVIGAFASRPATSAPAEQSGASGGGVSSGEGEATHLPSGSEATQAPIATATAAAPATAPTQPAATPTTASFEQPLSATQTAVAVAGQQGEVARVPVTLDFANATFDVQTGNNLLPDWKPAQSETTATWIANTVANHVLYIPYSARNEELFKAAKSGDIIKLTMNTGQVFSFSVTRAERAINGPPTSQGQFTVQTAMAQDHAGVTLFLIGDPASDRAVVQADFNGTIQ